MELKMLTFSGITCRTFYNADLGYGGVEVSQNGELLGQMVDEYLPDENDEDEVESFTSKVENWLIDNNF
jgi:hypothetical protein